MRIYNKIRIMICGIVLGYFAIINAGALTPPGDIATAAGTPLVAAHSMTRALYASYNGSLFQVTRASDSKTKDIGVTGAGGYVNMDTLNQFCSGTTCTVSKLYDQSGNKNDLTQTTASKQLNLEYWPIANGTLVPMGVTKSKQFLRNRTATSKIPTGSQSQTEYFVVHGLHYNSGCCYDYGNMEKTIHDNGAGTMNALYFGNDTWWGAGAGTGPWGKIDYENGVYPGGSRTNNNNPTTIENLVTVLSKTNGTSTWALKVGDAASGTLNTYWNGALPNGYSPLKQEGGLSLGEGGDGSNAGIGAFFEGVVIAAVTSDATDNLIQSSITAMFGTSKSSTFTPAKDPKMVAWWDANDSQTLSLGAGSAVKSWIDKSSHSYPATQVTAARQPVFFPHVLNGKGGLRFTRANNSVLTSVGSDNAFSHGFSMYYVIQPTTMSAAAISVFSQSTSTSGEPGLGFTTAGTNSPIAIAEFGSSQAGGSLKNTSLVPYIDAFVSKDGAPTVGGAFKATPYVNGSVGAILSQTIKAYTATGLHIGSDKFDDSFDGFIYEIAVSSDTTEASRLKYEEYFAYKYGIVGLLPSGIATEALQFPTVKEDMHAGGGLAVFMKAGLLHVNSPGARVSVRVCNLLGSVVYEHAFTGSTSGNSMVIDLHKVLNANASSMLFICVETNGKTIYSMQPIVKYYSAKCNQ